MKLEGIHHITAITADAQRNVDFYAGVLGLRLVKKSINQDHTSVYHLFFADETGDPGSDLTFFEYPGAAPGRAGDGMVHRIVWRVSGPAAIDFWEQRLAAHGYQSERVGPPAGESSGGADGSRGDRAATRPGAVDTLRFRDFEGLAHELAVITTTDEPLIAHHPEIPAGLALQGFDAVRAHASDPQRSQALLTDTLGFVARTDRPTEFEVRGDQRGGRYVYDPSPADRPLPGAGTVHHVAWASHPEDQEAWHELVVAAGAHATRIIDRYYFRSIYFREPSGVLFELATIGPGFTVDEPVDDLGEKLSLTPQFERLRSQIEPTLTPLRNPRDSWAHR
jgi:glyoxalase family protein